MAAKLKHIFPSGFEVIGLLLLTAVMILLGNSRQLIDYYGLSSTSHIIHSSTGGVINNGLAKLDSFSFTNTVVTFLLWSIAGVLSLSLIRAIGSVYRQLKYDEAVSSNRYIHPGFFSRKAFWQQVLLDFAGFVSYLALLAALLYLSIAFIWPIGLSYTSHGFTHTSLASFGGFVFGAFVLFASFCVLYVDIKLLISHRHSFART